MTHVDLLTLICYDLGTADLLGQHGVKLLNKAHHTVKIGICLIKLDGGEFGIVLGVHALVAEDTSHLIDPVHAADDEPFKIKLGLDTEIHIHIEGVVVSLEGMGVSTSRNPLESR